MPASALDGRFSTVPFGTDQHRQLARAESPVLAHQARPSASDVASSTVAGIAVAGQKILQATQGLGRSRNADQHGARAVGPATGADATQDERAHQDFLPSSAEPTIRARMCAASNGNAVQPSAPAPPEASVPRPESSLISPVNWPTAMRAISRLAVETVARGTISNLALQHQPGRGVTLADGEDGLALRESPRRAAGKAFGGLHLTGVENRKHLLAAVLRQRLIASPDRAARRNQARAVTRMWEPPRTFASAFTSPSACANMLHGLARRHSSPFEIGVRPKPMAMAGPSGQ